VPSCALMLKFEWPLIVPKNAPHRSAVETVAGHTFDISQYIVDIARNAGLAPGLSPLPGGVTLHLACHARAQNMGPKAAEMLRLIPTADSKAPDIKVVERCSGHGGSWGIMKENYEVALKIGKPVATQALKQAKAFVASECPLAGSHIAQGIERLGTERLGTGQTAKDGPATPPDFETLHPIEIFARAYGLAD